MIKTNIENYECLKKNIYKESIILKFEKIENCIVYVFYVYRTLTNTDGWIF